MEQLDAGQGVERCGACWQQLLREYQAESYGLLLKAEELAGHRKPGRRLEELEEEIRAASVKFEAALGEARLALGSPGLCQFCGPV